MIALLTAFVVACSPGYTAPPTPDIPVMPPMPAGAAPATPVLPPPLPTYVINGDGGRIDCVPNYQTCWVPTR